MTKIKCKYCKRLFEKRWKKQKFCSRECAGKVGNNKISKFRNGKTYEEIYGKNKGKNLKKKLSKIHIGLQANEKHPLYRKDINNIEIIKMYNSGLSTQKIGKILKTNRTSIRNRLIKKGMKLRKSNEYLVSEDTRKKQSKSKIINAKINPNYGMTGKHHSKEFNQRMSAALQDIPLSEWKGFALNNYNIGFNNKFKNLIRKRDNQICMICGIHREKLKRALDVHHISYDKTNLFEEDCISLCRSCHIKTNKNRVQWIIFFHDILSKKYSYVYNKKIGELK